MIIFDIKTVEQNLAMNVIYKQRQKPLTNTTSVGLIYYLFAVWALKFLLLLILIIFRDLYFELLNNLKDTGCLLYIVL